MTLLYSNYSGEDYLISFGGYNGRYSNEVTGFFLCHLFTCKLLPNFQFFSSAGQVYAFKLSVKLDLQSSTKDQPISDSTSRVLEPEVEISQDGKIREIAVDNADSVMSCFQI
jgi:hypothetical protein